MIVPIDLIVLLVLTVLAIAAIMLRDLLAAIVMLGAYSFLMANMWLQLGASDVGFTEAAVGAGTSTALMIAALSRLSKKARWEKQTKPLHLPGFLSVILLAAMFIYVLEDVPPFGDKNSPANKYIKLFSIDADRLVESLDAGVVPSEIKNGTERIGFNKENNFPTLEEGKYAIERNKKEDGWDVLIMKEEIFYPGPEKFYFIKEGDGKLEVSRYNWPVRVTEKTEHETATINAVTSGLADYRGYDTMFEETVIFTGAVSVILLLRRRGRL